MKRRRTAGATPEDETDDNRDGQRERQTQPVQLNLVSTRKLIEGFSAATDIRVPILSILPLALNSTSVFS
jgi:hypothetical protein